jgi:ABC-type glycerol-3-phosphate transport system substrate-binding protein
MCLYSGGYTVDYENELLNLRPEISPQVYRHFSGWELACSELDCSNRNPILGVPIDSGGLVLFYNKALFKRAGVPAAPFRNWTQMLAAAQRLKNAGIIPFTMGNRDGYSAANWVAGMFGSYISNGKDVNRLRTGALRWDSPKMVKPVDQYVKLYTMGLTNPDARTREQVDATGEFLSGKAAMVATFADRVLELREDVKQNLAVMKLPPAGNGPLKNAMNVVSGNNWVIPKDAKNPELAWEFVNMVSDGKSQTDQLRLKGTPPTNNTANLKAAKDPVLRTVLGYLVTKPTFLLLDNVVQADIATVWYSQLALAFGGRATPAAAMAEVEKAAKKLR